MRSCGGLRRAICSSPDPQDWPAGVGCLGVRGFLLIGMGCAYSLQELKVGLLLQRVVRHVLIKPPASRKGLQPATLSPRFSATPSSPPNSPPHSPDPASLRPPQGRNEDVPELQAAQLQSHALAHLAGVVLHVLAAELPRKCGSQEMEGMLTGSTPSHIPLWDATGTGVR